MSAGLICLALTVYHEARSESDLVKSAVAQTIENRVQIRETSICTEVFRKNQILFTKGLREFKHGDPYSSYFLRYYRIREKDEWIKAIKFVKHRRKLNLESTHFSESDPNTGWRRKLRRLAKIGTFWFYKES
jgi:spore germination cell wall hydrolase CwlJ-like protein